MAAAELSLIPKHMYIRDQSFAAQNLLDNAIKHKKPQLSYLNRLRTLNEPARTTTTTKTSTTDTPSVIPPTPEPPIVAKAENNPQKQALLLTSQDDDVDDDNDDEGNEMEKSSELSEAISTERTLLQLHLMVKHKNKRAKKNLEVNKKSDTVKIDKDNDKNYVDKLPTGLKASIFCIIYNN